MNKIITVLKDFIRFFEAKQIPYVVIGGIASRLYGLPRPTYDVDFTITLSQDKLPLFYAGVEEMGYEVPEIQKTGWV